MNNPEKKEEFRKWLVELGNEISNLRWAQQLTQHDFAKKLGISQSVVARIEKGQNMRCSTIWEIGKALHLPPEIIFFRNKPPITLPITYSTFNPSL